MKCPNSCASSMPSRVSENGSAHQQARRILPDPAYREQRQRVIVGSESRQAMDEVELQTRANDQSGEQRQQQQKNIQPIRTTACRRRNKDLWIGRYFEGVRDRPRGIRHRCLLDDRPSHAEANAAPVAPTVRIATARLLDRLQLLAGLEADGFAGRNVDLSAGARVATDARLARPHGEDAEAA